MVHASTQRSRWGNNSSLHITAKSATKQCNLSFHEATARLEWARAQTGGSFGAANQFEKRTGSSVVMPRPTVTQQRSGSCFVVVMGALTTCLGPRGAPPGLSAKRMCMQSLCLLSQLYVKHTHWVLRSLRAFKERRQTWKWGKVLETLAMISLVSSVALAQQDLFSAAAVCTSQWII